MGKELRRNETAGAMDTFTLRCGIVFGDSVEQVERKETQRPITTAYSQFDKKEFVPDTAHTFDDIKKSASLVKNWNTYSYEYLEGKVKDYKKKYFPWGGTVCRISKGKWRKTFDDYSRGSFVVKLNRIIPVNKDDTRWYVGEVAEKRCFIRYIFHPKNGLALLNYQFGEEDRDYGRMPDTQSSQRISGIETYFIKLLKEKYGEPLFKYHCSVGKNQFSTEQNVYNDIADEIMGTVDHGKKQDWISTKTMWRIPCGNGSVVICVQRSVYVFSFEESIDECYSSPAGRDLRFDTYEQECDVVYSFCPGTSFERKINNLTDKYMQFLKQKKQEELERREKIFSEI